MSCRAALLTAALLLAAAPAVGQTVYSGTGAAAADAAAAFDHALATMGPYTLETFDTRPEGQVFSFWGYGDEGLAILTNGFGVTSAYPYGGTAVSDPKGYGAYPNGGVGGDPVFTLYGPISGFGLYVVDAEETDSVVFSFAGGGTQTFALPVAGNGGRTFFGVTFDTFTAVNSVTIDLTGDDAVLLDDVRLAAGIPEPATWAVMLAGFGAAGAVLRGRRRGLAA